MNEAKMEDGGDVSDICYFCTAIETYTKCKSQPLLTSAIPSIKKMMKDSTRKCYVIGLQLHRAPFILAYQRETLETGSPKSWSSTLLIL